MTRLAVIGLALWVSACASNKTKVVESAVPESSSVSNKAQRQWAPAAQPAFAKLDTASAIPIEMNADVKKWVDYFSQNGRKHMNKYLGRSTRYITTMKQILRSYGLPEELVYVAMIESGFSSSAHSRASAVGYWQFIRETGRRYDLRIDAMVDERRDPVASTHAAAKYLKGLYSIFGSWNLAIAAYNSGENRIKRLVMENYTRDFWSLVAEGVLPEETANYVPKFMAARVIASDPAKYGFTDVPYEEPIRFATVTVRKSLSLARWALQMDVPVKELRRLNPSYRSDYVPVGRETVLRVPVEKLQIAEAAAAESVISPGQALPPSVYVVRNGDTLPSIARKHGISVDTLRRGNGFSRGALLRAGLMVTIPSAKKAKATQGKKAKQANQFHVVRRGDTLLNIAQRYRVSIASLQKMNSLGRGARIMAGSRLAIP